MTSTKTLTRESAPTSYADELTPLVHVHVALGRFRLGPTRVKRARTNLAAGRVAFDPADALRAATGLDASLSRVATAFEMCGLSSTRELDSFRKNYGSAQPLLKAWLVGERGSSDPGRRLALRAAAILGNGILRSAAAQVAKGLSFAKWAHATCPCCAGSPDLAVRDSAGRQLICSRCDSRWPAPTAGCLGCEVTRPPTFVRVDTVDLGYELLVCHACARYIKERPASGMASPMVERMLTAELDAAAERRGLRI
ncbi:MAG: formate dehydrogenase accessory protein FdhE [Gemmatimonadota bacterium]